MLRRLMPRVERLCSIALVAGGSNYRFVLSFNSALILLGALGILPPATSAMLHNLSTLGISLRLSLIHIYLVAVVVYYGLAMVVLIDLFHLA